MSGREATVNLSLLMIAFILMILLFLWMALGVGVCLMGGKAPLHGLLLLSHPDMDCIGFMVAPVAHCVILINGLLKNGIPTLLN
eukprot:1655618-Karenia_brevis.AAC.1